MDFYEISIAKIGKESYYISGMKNAKTIRVDASKHVDMQNSQTALGERKINNQTYIALDKNSDHVLKLSGKKPTNQPYLISANGTVSEYIHGKYTTRYTIDAYVDVKATLHLPKECTCKTTPMYTKKVDNNRSTTLYFHTKKVTIDVFCKR